MSDNMWPSFAMSIVLPVILVLAVLFVIFSIIDIIGSDFKDTSVKLPWILIVIFVPFFGSVIYFLFGQQGKRLA